MAAYLQSTNVTTTGYGDHAIDLAAGDDLYVLQGVTVAALGSSAYGVYGPGNGSKIDVYGTVISASGSGIVLHTNGSNQVFVSETGLISASPNHAGIVVHGGSSSITNNGSISAGSYGILTAGTSNSINNSGSISDGYYGIYASGGSSSITNNGSISTRSNGIIADGGSNSITNGGSISNSAYGIYAEGGSNSITNIGDITAKAFGVNISGSGNKAINYGTITAVGTSGDGILVESLAGETTKVVNYGTISSQVDGIDGRAGDETVINRGTIEGDVTLGAGADTYNGVGGVVIGSVLGGDGDDLLVGGGFDDFLFGGNHNDTLRGRGEDDTLAGEAGIDLLIGGLGDDLLTGGGGKDTLKGGAGEDVYDFNAITDSVRGAARDLIQGFEQGSDIIDLWNIDANTTATGNQKFRFIGDGAFAGTAGQLRAFTNVAGLTLVEGDVDGDGVADLQIQIANKIAFAATDFIL